MEALIKKPRLVSESAHQDLTNRSRLELNGHHLGALVITNIYTRAFVWLFVLYGNGHGRTNQETKTSFGIGSSRSN